MPILPLVEQKQMNADTIISPVVEIPESRKLSVTPNRSPIDNPSRYNPNANTTLAPGIDPSFGHYPQDPNSAGAMSNVMHTYPPPQMLNFKGNPQVVPSNNYTSYGMNAPQSYSGQTYPGLQESVKGSGPYNMNGLQISAQPYLNGNIQNGPNRGYPMTPVSALPQQQPSIFTSSPVDSATYQTETLGSGYYTQEPQPMANGTSDMGYDANDPLQYNPSAYQQMAYMNAQQQQRNYQFQS